MKKELVQETEDMICKKKAQKEMGNVFNYQDKERNWANASKMAEKNKALL